MTTTAQTHWLGPDDSVPNNPGLPLVVYRGALPRGRDAAGTIVRRFERNGWSNSWVNGIYPYHHYHATAHEVLGIAAGHAKVQFGGPSGPIIDVAAGDAVLIPAGVGHCRVEASADLTVVGAYPGGDDWDTVRAEPATRDAAARLVAAVPPPGTDPVTGERPPDWRRDG